MKNRIAGIILAAGQSKRMGTPKLLLPWKDATVLDSVIRCALVAGLSPILVVCGADPVEIHTRVASYAGRVTEVHNPEYERHEMFYSLKLGIRALENRCDAAILFLGDQPHVDPQVVTQIVQRFEDQEAAFIIPSYQMRRGHPMLIHADLFHSLLEFPDTGTLKEFLSQSPKKIAYISVDSSSVLEDMDSPADYERIKKNQDTQNNGIGIDS